MWSAGGTVYAKADAKAEDGMAGVDVLLSKADGTLIEKLITNSAGNFYTATPLPAGFRVAVEYQGARLEMPCSPPAGLCNFCHNDPPRGNAPGRIHIPQGADPNRPPYHCAGGAPDASMTMGGSGGVPSVTSGGSGGVPLASAGTAGTSSMPQAGSGAGGAAAASCTGEAKYRVNVDVTWNEATVDSRHFTTLIGGVHSDALTVWAPGGLATPGVKAMAESGNTTTLAAEVQAAIGLGSALSVLQFGGGSAPGKSSTELTVKPNFPLVSFGSMLAPTPDWFLGVSSLSLCEGGVWLASKSVPATVYDAGTKNGDGFDYGDGETVPRVEIAAAPLFGAPAGSITFEKL